MGHQIIQQPDGLFCVFSTVVDDFIFTDATAEELVAWYAKEAAERAADRTRHICERVAAGDARSVYHRFAMTYDEARETALSAWRGGKKTRMRADGAL